MPPRRWEQPDCVRSQKLSRRLRRYSAHSSLTSGSSPGGHQGGAAGRGDNQRTTGRRAVVGVPGRGARCVVTSAATDSGEEGLRFNSKRCVLIAMRGPKPHSCRYSANGLRSSSDSGPNSSLSCSHAPVTYPLTCSRVPVPAPITSSPHARQPTAADASRTTAPTLISAICVAASDTVTCLLRYCRKTRVASHTCDYEPPAL